MFTRVDQHFQALFRRMFGGGRAHLALVGSDDPLQAGLEIYAQPPGKKLATLSLLSGGEQALTALSLIFAVFRCNPAPVCVLDEVDAPLDDINVDRFCTLLTDMVRETGTRFMVVTHHPLTMASDGPAVWRDDAGAGCFAGAVGGFADGGGDGGAGAAGGGLASDPRKSTIANPRSSPRPEGQSSRRSVTCPFIQLAGKRMPLSPWVKSCRAKSFCVRLYPSRNRWGSDPDACVPQASGEWAQDRRCHPSGSDHWLNRRRRFSPSAPLVPRGGTGMTFPRERNRFHRPRLRLPCSPICNLSRHAGHEPWRNLWQASTIRLIREDSSLQPAR